MLAVIYLVFNEGYTATEGDALVRADLCAEAIRLARLLAELMPDEPEALGLLALLLLTEVAPRRAHRARRHDGAAPRPGPLALGPRRSSPKGTTLVRRCLRRNPPGPYQIQAAINAVHTDAPTAADTDWRQIVQLYDQLLAIAPSPVVALNRAVAVAELDGPAAALARGRRARPRHVPPVPLDPRRPARPARPLRRGARRVRTRTRAHGERGRAHAARAEARRATRRLTCPRAVRVGELIAAARSCRAGAPRAGPGPTGCAAGSRSRRRTRGSPR